MPDESYGATVTNAQTRLRKRWSRQGTLYGVEPGVFSPRILPSAIRIRAMRGPRDLYEEFSVGDGGNSSAGTVGAGTGFVGAAGTLAGVTSVFVADAVFARFRRLRDFPPSKTMRPYSATRARLVLTPCFSNKSATDLYDALLARNMTMNSWNDLRLLNGTRCGLGRNSWMALRNNSRSGVGCGVVGVFIIFECDD